MKRAYKIQLQHNLKALYCKADWSIKSNFENGRDEILLILPDGEQIATFHASLYDDLSLLPEIDHPRERVLISFCHQDGSGYCSRVINPSTQDEIHLALLGQLPSRKITGGELQDL
ncbi:MAG: hypothetical protein V4594_04635 [Bacteroidota bacterium]